MDCGYVDFRRLRRLADQGAFFVIRARPDVRFYVRASRIGSAALRCAPTRSFASTGPTPLSNWPGDLRRVTLLRCRQLPSPHLLEQSLERSSLDHRQSLPAKLAGRTVLPVAQTWPAHPDILRHE